MPREQPTIKMSRSGFILAKTLPPMNLITAETAIHVVCQSGGRSAKFCDRLRDNGYLSVYDVDGE